MSLLSYKSVTGNNFRRASILVVEDNEDHWVLIQGVLQKSLPEVNAIWAANAEQAGNYLSNCIQNEHILPKLMLLDLYLPEAEPTWKMLQEIRKPNSPFIRMPIVVFSQSTDRNDINEIYTYGGTSYITKPTDYQQWLSYFDTMRHYWWETVTLPSQQY